MNKFKSYIPAITSIVLVLSFWKFCPIMFQNNDDKFLLYMIAGYTTGKPSLYTVFGGFLWAGFISIFYRIYSGIAWYTVITIIVIVASLVVICRALVQSKNKFAGIAGVIVFIGLFFTTLCYFISAIQYTVTAAYVGVAGICALILADKSEKNRTKIGYLVTSAILITSSFGIRKEMGLVTMSCACIVLFFRVLQENRAFTIKAGAVIIISFLVVYFSNALYEKVVGLEAFNENYTIVQRWIDYPHIDIEDDQEGVYASVGWNKELYDAATEWFFLDKRVTPENIKVINDASSSMKLSNDERISRAIDIISNKQMINVQVILWIIILLIGNGILVVKKKDRDDVLTILCSDALFIFFLLLSIYFCVIQGRFPLRVYQALVIIYFIPSLVLLIVTLEKYECYKSLAVVAILMLCTVPVCYKLFPAGSMIYQAKMATHDADRQEYIAQVTALEEYATSHKENLYIYDYELSQPAAPFVTFEKGNPYNVLFWGGWTYDSPVYYQQLKANGREEILPEDLINGNVYLCGKSVDEVIYKYMQSCFGELDIEEIDRVGDIMIYRYCSK